MTGWQAIVVAPGNIRSRFYIAFGTDDNGLPFRYCDASPGIEYPRSSDIDTFTEFMIQTQTDGVAAVIFIRKPKSFVPSFPDPRNVLHPFLPFPPN